MSPRRPRSPVKDEDTSEVSHVRLVHGSLSSVRNKNRHVSPSNSLSASTPPASHQRRSNSPKKQLSSFKEAGLLPKHHAAYGVTCSKLSKGIQGNSGVFPAVPDKPTPTPHTTITTTAYPPASAAILTQSQEDKLYDNDPTQPGLTAKCSEAYPTTETALSCVPNDLEAGAQETPKSRTRVFRFADDCTQAPLSAPLQSKATTTNHNLHTNTHTNPAGPACTQATDEISKVPVVTPAQVTPEMTTTSSPELSPIAPERSERGPPLHDANSAPAPATAPTSDARVVSTTADGSNVNSHVEVCEGLATASGTSEETMTRTIANVVPQDEHLLAGERNAGLTHSGLTWSEAPALVEASAVVHEPMKTAQHNPDEIPQLMNAVIAMSVDQQEEESQDSPASELDASIPLQAEKDLPQTEPVQEHFASEDAICLVEKPVISIEAGACGDTEDRQQPIELQNEGDCEQANVNALTSPVSSENTAQQSTGDSLNVQLPEFSDNIAEDLAERPEMLQSLNSTEAVKGIVEGSVEESEDNNQSDIEASASNAAETNETSSPVVNTIMMQGIGADDATLQQSQARDGGNGSHTVESTPDHNASMPADTDLQALEDAAGSAVAEETPAGSLEAASAPGDQELKDAQAEEYLPRESNVHVEQLRLHLLDDDSSDGGPASMVREENQKDDGSNEEELGPTDFVYVEMYRGKAGTVPVLIGTEERAKAAAGEVINDSMARLKNGMISEEEFVQYMISRGGQEASQAVKRLAELAVDLTRDVTRLHATVAAFGRLSRATEPHEVEQTLIECLVEPLGLSSARMYLVNSARKTASSMSGPAVITSWRPQAMEQNPSLVAWAAKLGIGVNVTDSSTERRYNLAIDGPAHSCLALPVKSGGLDGELLAVLSIRKIFPELMAGNAGARHVKPPGLHRNEETFIRTLAVATGPFLYLVQTMRAMKQQAEKTVINLEHLQKAGCDMLKGLPDPDAPKDLVAVASHVERVVTGALHAQSVALKLLDTNTKYLTTITVPEWLGARDQHPAKLSNAAYAIATQRLWHREACHTPPLRLKAAEMRRVQCMGPPITGMLVTPLFMLPATASLLQPHVREILDGTPAEEGVRKQTLYQRTAAPAFTEEDLSVHSAEDDDSEELHLKICDMLDQDAHADLGPSDPIAAIENLQAPMALLSGDKSQITKGSTSDQAPAGEATEEPSAAPLTSAGSIDTNDKDSTAQPLGVKQRLVGVITAYSKQMPEAMSRWNNAEGLASKAAACSGQPNDKTSPAAASTAGAVESAAESDSAAAAAAAVAAATRVAAESDSAATAAPVDADSSLRSEVPATTGETANMSQVADPTGEQQPSTCDAPQHPSTTIQKSPKLFQLLDALLPTAERSLSETGSVDARERSGSAASISKETGSPDHVVFPKISEDGVSKGNSGSGGEGGHLPNSRTQSDAQPQAQPAVGLTPKDKDKPPIANTSRNPPKTPLQSPGPATPSHNTPPRTSLQSSQYSSSDNSPDGSRPNSKRAKSATRQKVKKRVATHPMFDEEDASVATALAEYSSLLLAASLRGSHREKNLIYTQRLNALWYTFLREVPSLHSTTNLPQTVRKIVSMGVRLLNCTYCGFYRILALSRGFAEKDTVPSHHYAAVQGDRAIDAAPLRRRRRTLSGTSEGFEAPTLFRSIRRKRILSLNASQCVVSDADEDYFEGFTDRPKEVDEAVDPLREEDWNRKPPCYFTNALVMPLLCPHYAQLSEPALGDNSATVHVLPQVPSEEIQSIAVVPGIPTGKPTKLPVAAALLFAWSTTAQEESVQAIGFSSEKEQLAYALAEQANMAFWNCLQAAAQSKA